MLHQLPPRQFYNALANISFDFWTSYFRCRINFIKMIFPWTIKWPKNRSVIAMVTNAAFSLPRNNVSNYWGQLFPNQLFFIPLKTFLYIPLYVTLILAVIWGVELCDTLALVCIFWESASEKRIRTFFVQFSSKGFG